MTDIKLSDMDNKYLALGKQTMDEIRYMFLGLAKLDRKGFNISFDKVLEWIGAYEDKPDIIQQKKMKDHLMERYIKEPEYGIMEGLDYIIIIDDTEENKKNRRKTQSLLFSDDGMKYFCAIYKTPKSILVRRYFIQLEKDYIKAIEQTYEENAKSREIVNRSAADIQTCEGHDCFYWCEEAKKLDKERKATVQLLTNVGKKLHETEEKLAVEELNSQFVESHAMILKKKLEETSEQLHVNPEYNKYMETQLLKKEFMKTVYISLVDPSIFYAKKAHGSRKPRGKSSPAKKANSPTDKTGAATKKKNENAMSKYGISFKTLKELDMFSSSDEAEMSETTPTAAKARKRLVVNKEDALEADDADDTPREIREEYVFIDYLNYSASNYKLEAPPRSDIMYYSLSIKEPGAEKKGYVQLGVNIYAYNIDHFRKLKEYLSDPKNKALTPKKDIWQTSINNMEIILRGLFIAEKADPVFKAKVMDEFYAA